MFTSAAKRYAIDPGVESITCKISLIYLNDHLDVDMKVPSCNAKMEVFLSKVGRKKFLQPLYSELMSQDKYKPLAKELFEKYKNNYHPQTAEKISGIVNPQK